MKIINLSQREDDWLEWRSQGITATDACVILDKSPYKTVWRLWAEKTGYASPVDLSFNPQVRRGVEQEDDARRCFEEKHDELLLPVCVESTEWPILRASLDGLSNSGEPVELKCPSESVWNDVCTNGKSSEAYQLYYFQVQHQIMVTGATKGWLVFYFNGDIQEFTIERDDAVISEIIVKAKEFWQQIIDRKEPEKDPLRDLYIPKDAEATEWINAAEDYRLIDDEIQCLKAQLQNLQERQKPLLNTMKALMGEYYHADYCGVMVTRYTVAGRVNYDKLIAEKGMTVNPDELDRYRSKPSERCRVTVTGSVMPRLINDEDALEPLKDLPDEVETYYW